MNIGLSAVRAQKFVSDNSPAIMTGLGVTGTVVTALLAGQAGYKASLIINGDADTMSGRHLTNREIVENCWKLYIPAAAVGAATIACVIGANRVGARRAGALAAAYTLSEKAFLEYKSKVIEKIGEQKEQTVRDEIAQDRVNRNPSGGADIFVTGAGEVLCYDSYTDRYFFSDMEKIRRAVNDINKQILHDMYASLGDFYQRIDLPRTEMSEEVGWTTDNTLDVNYSAALTDSGKPCIVLTFAVKPIRNYYKFG